MASERIHNEYDATRIANAVDTLAENLAGYTPESPVTPTNAMKAKLPSQSTGDRIADAVESLAQNFNGSNTVVADTEVSPAENTHDIGTYLTYNGKEYVVLKYIDIGDPLDYESGDPNIEEVSLPDGTYIVTDDGDGEGGGGSSSADDISYDNTTSGLTADNVQNAIDEVNARIEGLGASDITFDNTDTGMTADDVQEAIGELNSNIEGIIVATADGNQTWATQIATLYTAWQNLTQEQKIHSKIIAQAANGYGMILYPGFANTGGYGNCVCDGSGMSWHGIRLSSSRYAIAEIPFGGSITCSNKSSENNQSKLLLVRYI